MHFGLIVYILLQSMLVLPINFFAFIYIFFNVLKYYIHKKVFMQYLL